MAYGMLMGVVRSSDGMVYWGDREIETNRVRYEFNRPFLEAKDYQDLDGEAVEATAYALRTMFLIEGGGLTKKHYHVCAYSSSTPISLANPAKSLHRVCSLYKYYRRTILARG